MPIIYDQEKKGFRLDKPTEEEIQALENLAIEYVTSTIAKMAAFHSMKHNLNGEHTPECEQANAAPTEEQPQQYDFHFIDPKTRSKH